MPQEAKHPAPNTIHQQYNPTALGLGLGYSYFGARYYDSDLCIWLSVDPLASKYPSVSAFMYCAGNPIIYKDEFGLEPGDPVKAKHQGKVAGFFAKLNPWRIVKPNGDILKARYHKGQKRVLVEKKEKKKENYDIARVDYSTKQEGTISTQSNGKPMEYNYYTKYWHYNINVNIPPNPFNDGINVKESTFSLLYENLQNQYSENNFKNAEGSSFNVNITYACMDDVRLNQSFNWQSNGGLPRDMIYLIPWSYKATSVPVKVKVSINWLGIRQWKKAVIVDDKTPLTTNKIHHY